MLHLYRVSVTQINTPLFPVELKQPDVVHSENTTGKLCASMSSDKCKNTLLLTFLRGKYTKILLKKINFPFF